MQPWEGWTGWYKTCIMICFVASACSTTPLPEAYQRGVRLEAADHDQQALSEYRQASKGCHMDSRICRLSRIRVAETLTRLGDFDQAVRAYLKLQRWTRDPATASKSLLCAGRIVERDLHQPDRALRLYLKIMIVYPAESAAEDALRRTQRIYCQRNKKPELIELLIKLYQRLIRSPLADNLLFVAAQTFEEHKDLEQALQLYDRISSFHRHSRLRDDALWCAAQILEQKRRFREALHRYRLLLATRKDAFLIGSYNSIFLDDAQLRIGLIRFSQLEDSSGALEALTNLRDDFPDSVLRDDAQWWIAQIHLKLGNRLEACLALERLIKRFPYGNHVRRAQKARTTLYCP